MTTIINTFVSIINFFKAENIVLLFVLLSLVIFTTCKKDPPDEPDVAVPETTVVINEQTWETTFTGIDSTSKTLYFDDEVLDLTEIEPGDYIISTEGNGLLRKVTGITETTDGIKVETSFASLTDVIYDGETSFNTILSQQNIEKITYLRKGVEVDTSMMNAEKDAALEYNIDTYLDDAGNIHIYGDFTLETLLEGNLSIGMVPPRVKLFELTYTIDQDLFLASEIDFSNVNYEDEVDLASITFTPIIAMMAGVPILLVPELEIVAGVEMGIHCDVYTDITQSMDYTIGIRYENKAWNTINNFYKTFDYTAPIIDCSAEARVYIKPQFNVKIYNVVSPYLFADLYARLDADINTQPWWSLYGGANMGVGVEAEILGKEIFDFYTDPPLIEYEQLIASASGTFEDVPVAAFSAQPLSGDVPLQVAFTDESLSSPESWNWYFGDGSTSTQQNPTHTYTAEWQYTVTLTVENDNGSDCETKTNYITVTDGGGGGGNWGEPCPGTPTVTDIDGNVYNTVLIGNQCWIKENLKVTHYPNGDEIPYISDNGEWIDLVDNNTDDAYCFYDNDTNIEYGALYSYAAAIADNWQRDNSDGQGICPAGWHMPTDTDWTILTDYLGGVSVAGGEMKEAGTSHWNSPNTGATNKSGFTALPGGIRYYYHGTFGTVGLNGYWWSATERSSFGVWYRRLYYNNAYMTRSSCNKSDGFSVRCTREAY